MASTDAPSFEVGVDGRPIVVMGFEMDERVHFIGDAVGRIPKHAQRFPGARYGRCLG